MERITVVVADDHSLLRHGLMSLLQRQAQISVVGEASDGMEAVEQVRKLAPNVVVMDLKMPKHDGVTATRRIAEECPGTTVVVLTVSEDDDDLLAAVEAGAKGYLLKNATLDELLRAIRAASLGEGILSPTITAKVLQRVRSDWRTRNHSSVEVRQSGAEHGPLTRREIQVLRLLARGVGTRAMATQLFISGATARHHIDSIMNKLGAHNRLEAVARAMELKLIDA